MASAIRWTPFDDFLQNAALWEQKPSEAYRRAFGEESGFNPLMEYSMASGRSPSTFTYGDQGFKDWARKLILNGQSPEDYVKAKNAAAGLGSVTQGIKGQGGLWYDPKTGQIGTQSFDDDMGDLMALGLMAPAVGGIVAAAGAGAGAGAGLEGLAAADAAGGLVPEFGTNAAYDAATGFGGSVGGSMDLPLLDDWNFNWDTFVDKVPEVPATSGPEVFRDPWDLLPDPYNTYQTPNVIPYDSPLGTSGLFDNLPTGLKDLVTKLIGSPGGANAAGGILKALGIDPSSILGEGLSLAARSAPGLMALEYAKSQPGIDTSNLEGVLGRLGGNTDAIVKAATDPLQANIAAGYGDLLQSLGLRGVRGSSFGNTDIANYIGRTGDALADAGARASQGSLAMQGDLAAKIAALKAQAQTTKNAMFGRAFDVLGRGLNPGGFGSQLTLAR